jgi:hypothetical protein
MPLMLFYFAVLLALTKFISKQWMAKLPVERLLRGVRVISRAIIYSL